jgi:hypothetical protein
VLFKLGGGLKKRMNNYVATVFGRKYGISCVSSFFLFFLDGCVLENGKKHILEDVFISLQQFVV